MANDSDIGVAEFHWMLEMFQTIDVGLVVIDRDYRIGVWNGFMEHHSGLRPDQVQQRTLFELFPEIPEKWFRHKAESAFLLHNRAFTIWEQRPYLFRFRNYRPITGSAEFMYQNVSIIPLRSLQANTEHLCIIVYDVTDVAVNKIAQTEANAELARVSRTDALTGLLNRGAWQAQAREEAQRCRRTGHAATLVLFDLDHFKHVNDTHGHPAGDEVLRRTAELLRRSVRETDYAGRYGGEEFGVLLIDTSGEQASYFAERLRRRIETATIEHAGTAIPVTISLGLASFQRDFADEAAWISAADEALYRSKENGRNRYTVAPLPD